MIEIRKVLICGARDWGDIAPVRREVRRLIKKYGKDNLLIIAGKAPGADQMAKVVSDEQSVHCAEIGALWGTRYKGAGPQRNDMMLALEPHEAVAFHKALSQSRGTKDMIKKLHREGISVKVVDK